MTINKFSDFINALIVENLHPEIQSIVQQNAPSHRRKQTLLANKIKELSQRGESTGIEGNMPKGSSRAYMKHEEPHQITLDGKPASIPVGTKVAIRASLDKHHNHPEGMSLGQMQMQKENADWYVNSAHRVLREDSDKGKGHYQTNEEGGIFPPLIEHDHENHNWSTIGHCRDIKKKEFETLTKNKEYPKGISHSDFCLALERFHDRNNGRYWEQHPETERELNHVTDHPLVQKFIDYHGNTAAPPHDYRQLKNMGVFEHPDGRKMIVARDHGFDNEVQSAYRSARQRQWKYR